MTTIAAVHLSESLQALIDARLDTIERMLMDRVPRRDRAAIVREVESQIHDLLGERDGESLGRDDVLAVLARLDPPEAYLPEESAGGPAVARPPTPARTASPARDDRPGAARAGGILGICSLVPFILAPVLYLVAAVTEFEILFFIGVVFGAAVMSFVVGLIGIALAIHARLRGTWAVVGLVAGIVSVLFSTIGIAVLVLLLR